MDALDHLQELILDGKSVRLSDLGLFSIGMSSKAEDTKEKVTAASVEGVHLIVRNTKSWSNTELRKKCKIQEYGGYIGTDEEGTTGGGTTVAVLNRAAALTPARAAQVLPVAEPKKAAEADLRIAAMGLNKALA